MCICFPSLTIEEHDDETQVTHTREYGKGNARLQNRLLRNRETTVFPRRQSQYSDEVPFIPLNRQLEYHNTGHQSRGLNNFEAPMVTVPPPPVPPMLLEAEPHFPGAFPPATPMHGEFNQHHQPATRHVPHAPTPPGPRIIDLEVSPPQNFAQPVHHHNVHHSPPRQNFGGRNMHAGGERFGDHDMGGHGGGGGGGLPAALGGMMAPAPPRPGTGHGGDFGGDMGGFFEGGAMRASGLGAGGHGGLGAGGHGGLGAGGNRPRASMPAGLQSQARRPRPQSRVRHVPADNEAYHSHERYSSSSSSEVGVYPNRGRHRRRTSFRSGHND